MSLTERFGTGDDVVTDTRFRSMRRYVRRQFEDNVGKPPFVPHLVIGTGGTFTNLAAMSLHRGMIGRESAALPFAVRGYELQRPEVNHLLELLRKLPVRERARVPGLNPERADIIVAGLAIVEGALKHLGANRLRVHDEGIRSGLLHQMIEQLHPTPDGGRHKSADRMRGVRQFAAACDHDHRHTEHVTELALSMYDDLIVEAAGDAESWVEPRHRELLHAAAILHDVGYLINYSRHHKHSYHLILHSGLYGFTHRELKIIANVARYHRGAKPKLKHANFVKLDEEEQQLVRRLAAILRLAVGPRPLAHAAHPQRQRALRRRHRDIRDVRRPGAGGRDLGSRAQERPLRAGIRSQARVPLDRDRRRDDADRLVRRRGPVMKTLLVMRHAKSSWKDMSLDDHDRPLNTRGRRDAPRMGEVLLDHELVPDAIVTSTARRARDTADAVARAVSFDGPLARTERLYHAGPREMCDVLGELPDASSTVMLVGHNPGLEDLVESFTGAFQIMPTAAVAVIELPVDEWRDVDATTAGRLVRVWRPKELDD